MKFDKDDISALFCTVIIHLVLLFLLYWGVLRSFVPIDDGGIPINFGDLLTSTGMYEPPPVTVQPQRQTPLPQTPATTPAPEVKPITQNREESVSVPDTTKKVTVTATAADTQAQREREEAERRRQEEAERQRREEAERRQQEETERRQQEEALRQQQQAIDNRVSNAFGVGSSQETNQGDGTTGTTNQGSPFGNSGSGPNEGTGGFGTFNLNGRSIGSGGLPRPSYNEREEGRIVINITVDPNGNVILAEIGRGTNIDNASMRNSALDAARRAKFNRIQGTNNQTGTITYNYRLN